ncbi:MAG: DUF3810 domain-containing protein [Candidatus Eisenbacteria bacterium]
MGLPGLRRASVPATRGVSILDLLGAVLALLAGVAASRIATIDRPLVESVYARGLYPWIAFALAVPARAAASFCIAPFLTGALAIAAIVWIAAGVRPGGAPRAAVRLLSVAALAVWFFLLFWGFNHARPALLDRLGLPRVPATAEALARLSASLSIELEQAQREAAASGEIVWPSDGSGSPLDPSPAGTDPGGRAETGGRLAIPLDRLSERLAAGHRSFTPVAIGRVRYARPKTSRFLSYLYTRIGIAGIYSPFTGEATYNGAMPDAAIPFAIAHEMAHQRATAREDESNFLAFVACRKSGSPAARYSAALGAWRTAIAAYASVAPDSARALAARIPEPARRDLRAIRSFWQRHAGPTADVAERVNDAYLKASGDRRGVRSYGRMIDLLLAYEETVNRP